MATPKRDVLHLDVDSKVTVAESSDLAL